MRSAADGYNESPFSDEERILRFVQSLLSSSPDTRPTAARALADEIFESIAANVDPNDGIAFDSSRQAMHSQSHAFAHDRPEHAPFARLPQWTWLLLINSHLSLTSHVECFLKSSNPSMAFHLRKTQEALRFFDDFLPDHPVHILRLEHDARLTFRITLDPHSPVAIERIVRFSVKLVDEDFVELEMVQRDRGETVEAMAFLQPSKLLSKKWHVVSPSFGLIERKYVALTVKLRILLSAPISQEIDMSHILYFKIVHSRARLRLHRFLRMFENQAEHDIHA